MKKHEKQPIKFERKRLIITIVYLCLSLISYQVTVYINKETHRYLYQCVFALGTVLLILFCLSARKLFTRDIMLEFYRRVSEAMFNVGERWRKITKKIREKLGIKERTLMRGTDERSIVYDNEIRRGRKKRVERQRYSDMTNNRERIRFLWAKYVISLTKKGQQPSISQTPDEMKESFEIAEEPAEELFALYYTARYAPDGITIDDHDVNDQAEFVGTKGRL